MAGSAAHFDKVAGDWDNEPRRVALMKAIGEAILREAEPTSEMDVLDYGCGTGLIGLFLLPHVRTVTGADNSPGMLEELRSKIAAGGLENIQATQLDLEQDPRSRRSVSHDRCRHGHAPYCRHGESPACLPRNAAAGRHALSCRSRHGARHFPSCRHGRLSSIITDSTERDSNSSLADIGFSQMKDTTALTFSKPVEGQDDQEFSVFLMTSTT